MTRREDIGPGYVCGRPLTSGRWSLWLETRDGERTTARVFPSWDEGLETLTRNVERVRTRPLGDGGSELGWLAVAGVAVLVVWALGPIGMGLMAALLSL